MKTIMVALVAWLLVQMICVTSKAASTEQCAGVIVLCDGQHRIPAKDKIRGTAAWLDGRIEFKYDFVTKEFRLIGYTSDGAVQRNDALTRVGSSFCFLIEKVRGDGMTTRTEISFDRTHWVFHLTGSKLDFYAEGENPAIADFLKCDHGAADMRKS